MLPPPLNISNTSSSYAFIRLIPLSRKLQLVYFERREAVLVDLEPDAQGPSGTGSLGAVHVGKGW
jgi:hypothetical protein